MPAATISLAGIPICLDTPYIRAWINQQIPLEDFIPNQNGLLDSYLGPGTVGLTRSLTRRPRPKPKLNHWYYPNGMSNWSEAWFLITQQQYDALIPLAYSAAGTPQALTFSVSTGLAAINTSMYLLPPYPIAKVQNQPGLFVCVIVDERYYNAYKPATSGTGFGNSWESLIDGYAADIGISIGALSISSDYADPIQWGPFDQNGENAALLMDTALANVGQYAIRNYDGSYAFVDASQSGDIQATNIGLSYKMAGGDFYNEPMSSNPLNALAINSILPASVTVYFPKALDLMGNNALNSPQPYNYFSTVASSPLNIGWSHHEHIPFDQVYGGADAYLIQIALNTLSFTNGVTYQGVTGTQKRIYTTAPALFATTGSGSPNNLTDCTNLAGALVADYYVAQLNGADYVLPGVVPVNPDGLNDIWFKFSMDGAATRVTRRPFNYQLDQYLHGFTPSTFATPCDAGVSVEVITPSTVMFDTMTCALTFTSQTLCMPPGTRFS